MKVFDNTELNPEQLDNATGGTSPRYPSTGASKQTDYYKKYVYLTLRAI